MKVTISVQLAAFVSNCSMKSMGHWLLYVDNIALFIFIALLMLCSHTPLGSFFFHGEPIAGLAGCRCRGAASNPYRQGLCAVCQTFRKAVFPVRDARP
jgi:hypothetical protein